MVEPSLEFIGRRLLAIQDEQRSLRHRISGIESRLSGIESRLDGANDRLDFVAEQINSLRAEIVDLINEKLK